ncbi:MAG: PEP-CTERM sorting domain-containing protein [Planctomycetes bacterium]|nr:PEP-CTERM sorting domain-containing protein [Planctomycetota bacterium]
MRHVFIALAIAVVVAPALADDLYQPPWDRYGPTSTYSHWSFDTDAPDPGYILPEEGYNPFGECYLNIPYALDYDYWMDSFEGRQGVWYIDPYDYIEIINDNDPEPRPLKEVYLQITWWADPSGFDGDRPAPEFYDTPGGSDFVIDIEEDLGGGWWYTRYYATIKPNPNWEEIDLWAEGYGWEMYIDQIVLDTICLPEPSALALLGLGGLLILRRR